MAASWKLSAFASKQQVETALLAQEDADEWDPAVVVTGYAIATDASIHTMVENAYRITLAGAFVPLTAGLFWRRASTTGAPVERASAISLSAALSMPISPSPDPSRSSVAARSSGTGGRGRSVMAASLAVSVRSAP